MILRSLEICPGCGQAMPWRKYASRVVRGERVIYAKCVRCGRTETIIYRPNPQKVRKVPERGT